jgi:hypothetical protein
MAGRRLVRPPCGGPAVTNPRNATTTSAGRTYRWRDNETFTSVTTIIGGGVPKPALVGWAAKRVAEIAVARYPVWTQMQSEAEKIDWLKRAPYREQEGAAIQGTAIHEWAEQRVLGLPVTAESLPDEQQPYAHSFLQFVHQMNPTWEMSEATVYNREHGYAGTLDALLTLDPQAADTIQTAGGPDLHGLGLVDYKGLALETPLPTPDGWTTMQAVQVGDEVFGSDGRPCRVTGKSGLRYRPCYRIRFDDGSSVVCDDEHLWAVASGRHGRLRHQVLTTVDIKTTLRSSGGQRQHRVLNASPLDLPAKDLPIDPYVLGCWLGDGSKNAGVISKPDDELFANIADCGYSLSADHNRRRDRCQTRTVLGLRRQLRDLGLLGHKHVPAAYLRGSFAQRLALLQGLMDSDGSWHRTRRQATFTTTDKGLAADVYELVVSLGWRASAADVYELVVSLGRRASANTHIAHGFGLTVIAHTVTFTPFNGNPFRLTRKAELVRPGGSRQRIIHSVERTIDVPTQCIAVDSADNTYLCGEQMVPTHNTNKSGIFPETALQLAAYRNAEFVGLPDGSEQPMPKVDWCAALWVTDHGYQLIPINAGHLAFEYFLAARLVHDFCKGVGSMLLLPAAVLPQPAPRPAAPVNVSALID